MTSIATISFRLAACALLASSVAWADQGPLAPILSLPAPAAQAATSGTPSAPTTLKGRVLEIVPAGSYLYLRLQTGAGETWAAIARGEVRKGDQVVIDDVTVMNNFRSKTLDRVFPSLAFGHLRGQAAQSPHGTPLAAPVDLEHIKVAKAQGPDAYSVAAIAAQRQALDGKTVAVRGKVVKFSPEIMGRNWIHLRDGSGSAAEGSDDILVTSADKVAVGDVVTARGTVRVDQDFGSGYAYRVLIEGAKLLR